jgi:hypothetical protein
MNSLINEIYSYIFTLLRFQTAPEGKYTSLLQVYRELIKADGIGAFYKGFTPVILRFNYKQKIHFDICI